MRAVKLSMATIYIYEVNFRSTLRLLVKTSKQTEKNIGYRSEEIAIIYVHSSRINPSRLLQ